MTVWVDRLTSRQDDWFGQLAQPIVDGQLPDRGLSAKAVEIGSNVVLPRFEPLSLERQSPDVEPRRGHANLLREREEGEHEGHDDGAEDQAEPIRPLAGAEGTAHPTPTEGRALRDPGASGQGDRSRSGSFVYGHRSVAQREPDARRPRIEEREWVGLGGGPPFAKVELEGVGMLSAVVSFTNLVLAAPVGLAATGLVALAHWGLLLLPNTIGDTWA
jgi:hypothetical protein